MFRTKWSGLRKVIAGLLVLTIVPVGYLLIEQVINLYREQAEGSYQLQPGVIIVPGRKPAAYIMGPQKSIEAIELRFGKLRWNSTEAIKPLLKYKDYIISQAGPLETHNSLRIAALNTNDGEKRFHVDVKLPPDVQALVYSRPNASFHLKACHHEDQVYIAWLYEERSANNTVPDKTESEEHQTTGQVRLDIHTRQTEPVSTEQVPCSMDNQIPSHVTPLVESNKLTRKTWHTEKILATTSIRHDEGADYIVLERWDIETGAALPPVTLYEITGRRLQIASVDNRYLMTYKMDNSGITAENKALWDVFSLETGKLVADARSEIRGGSFFLSYPYHVHMIGAKTSILDGKKVYEPQKIRAIDLQTGIEAWIRPVHSLQGNQPGSRQNLQ